MNSVKEEVSVEELVGQLRALGVAEGDVLEVHTAFSRVRPVQGGPLGLIEALRRAVGEEGTLVMPTMSDGSAPYDPRTTPTYEMGIVAEMFRQLDGVLRSPHPGASFAALGPHAALVCAPHPLEPPHGHDSPVGRVYDLDGKVLLLGVGHGEDTMVHLAEDLARVPYRVEHPCVVQDERGEFVEVMLGETDHCCENFNEVEAWLRASGVQREGRVGHARAKLVRARALIDEVVPRLEREPLLFLCDPSAECEECDRARASIP